MHRDEAIYARADAHTRRRQAGDPLPTEPGSVIGWAFYNDGINHYGVAVLTWTDPDDSDGLELRWHLAGFPEPRTADEMARVNSWQDLGQIETRPVALRPSTTLPS